MKNATIHDRASSGWQFYVYQLARRAESHNATSPHTLTEEEGVHCL